MRYSSYLGWEVAIARHHDGTKHHPIENRHTQHPLSHTDSNLLIDPVKHIEDIAVQTPENIKQYSTEDGDQAFVQAVIDCAH